MKDILIYISTFLKLYVKLPFCFRDGYLTEFKQ